jgi:hypothetical protein
VVYYAGRKRPKKQRLLCRIDDVPVLVGVSMVKCQREFKIGDRFSSTDELKFLESSEGGDATCYYIAIKSCTYSFNGPIQGLLARSVVVLFFRTRFLLLLFIFSFIY